MKVVCLVPGSGGTFYCQNCLRDLDLVRALRETGVDASRCPLYLPMLEGDAAPGPAGPVFFGAINVYLEEKLPAFRRAPAWLRRWLDAPALLRAAARRAGSTTARGLEDMTLSMLRGEAGHQRRELEQLVDWLRAEGVPDVVHLSNALLLGLAPRLRHELGASVVCSLQDEDVWMNAMEPGAAEAAWRLMAERARAVDAFLSPSRYFADVMAPRLGIDAEAVRIVPLGVPPEAYPATAAAPDDAPVIGFLSREAEGLGLATLCEAFLRLRREPRFGRVRLRVSGGELGADRRYVAGIRRRLRRAGVEGAVEFVPDFDRADRVRFLSSLSLLSVPAHRETAGGRYLLEAMAAGVPVVQPEIGAFPELIAATGGGITYRPHTAEALADALASLLDDRARARALGERGRAAVAERFSLRRMAEATAGVYTEVRNRAAGRRPPE